MTTESELRDRLYRAAWQVGPCGDDLAAADAVIARRCGERRHRGAVLAAVVCVLAIAVLVPVVGGRWSTRTAPANPATATATPTTIAPPPTDRWTAPPRGSLAGDRTFLRSARNLAWPDSRPSAPAAARAVVFAGDAGGTRWVLVAGPIDGQLTGQWFTGPAGAAADALTADVPEDLQGGFPFSDVHLDATGATLLVLTAPGDQVQVSPGVVVDADGQTGRSYTPVPTHDGVAVVHETGAYAGVAVRFHVLRGGYLAGAGPTGGAVHIPEDLGNAARQTPRRPSSGSAPEAAVTAAMQQVLNATGLGPAEVHPVLLWTGPVPPTGGMSSQAVVLALTMPSGAVVTTTAIGSGDHALASGLCGSSVHPAGTPLDSLVIVARCDTSMSTSGQQSFVVSAPPGRTRLVLQMTDGSTVTQQVLAGGSRVVTDPGGVATVGVSGTSMPTVRVTPSDQAHDPLDVN